MEVAQVPEPILQRGQVLVHTEFSFVSPGTERAINELASQSMIGKARARPDLLRRVVEKARREGLESAVRAVQSRLEVPSATGYSAAGRVAAIDPAVRGLRVGERVACAGVGYANHAEVNAVPQLLVARIPDGVTTADASSVALGAIAMQGVRTVAPQYAEIVVVIGLGMIGLLTVQLCRAAGAVVIGVDPISGRGDLATKLGAVCSSTPGDAAALVDRITEGRACDAVLIAASTKTSQPVELAGTVARRKGRVVVVGAVGMTIPRDVYYKKELSLHLSTSYGPGRYDHAYEEEGVDYPYAYVRWTETRNMEAYLLALARKEVVVEPLIEQRVPIENAAGAYGRLLHSDPPPLGIVIEYGRGSGPGTEAQPRPETGVKTSVSPISKSATCVRTGIIGAGAFAQSVLLPRLASMDSVKMVAVASGKGVSALAASRRFRIPHVSDSAEELCQRDDVDAVVIATRHEDHARVVLLALESGKHVFVEKPLCVTEDELSQIGARARSRPELACQVGFNRRFAPLAEAMKSQWGSAGGVSEILYRVAAGSVPDGHWTLSAHEGGRLIGEVCHFIDFCLWLVGETPTEVTTRSLGVGNNAGGQGFLVSLGFPSGARAQIPYIVDNARGIAKEACEVHGSGVSAALDDFRKLRVWRGGRTLTKRLLLRQDKGHRAELEHFARWCLGARPTTISFEDAAASMSVTLRANAQLTTPS